MMGCEDLRYFLKRKENGGGEGDENKFLVRKK